MDIKSVNLITFSPTETSRTVGEAIARGYSSERCVVTDLTVKEPDGVTLAGDTFAIITAPVYGGHVAPVAARRLKRVHGKKTPAVVVAVYGNRDYEKALVELGELATENGFVVMAGATFIGEHSYCTAEYPIAQGRPDDADICFAETFGGMLRSKIKNTPRECLTDNVRLDTIKHPPQRLLPKLRFIYGALKIMKGKVHSPKCPTVNTDLCVHCGKCVSLCPVAAIDKVDESLTDPSKCIKCCACVKFCPKGARTLNSPFAPLLAKNFKDYKRPEIML